jgi:hypothetical protein
VIDRGTENPPIKGLDELARIAVRRFRDAVNWQSREDVGGASLRTVLRRCHDQMHGLLDPDDAKIAERLGVRAHINLTVMKGGVVQAFLRESLVQTEGLPWTLAPTPLPQLSARSEREAVAAVKTALFSPDSQVPMDPESVVALIREIKRQYVAIQNETARTACKAMEKLMFDQIAEGGWHRALDGFLTNFVYYPYAVMHGPRPVRRPRLSWAGDRVKVKAETFYAWDNVSPWDFWYSGDSRTPRDGTGVFIRERMTRRHLMDMLGMRSYIGGQIEDVLDDVEQKDRYAFHWMSENPDQPTQTLLEWVGGTATIDSMIHYGFFSGRELSAHGVSGLDDRVFYDACLTIIGGRTVQVLIAPDPSVASRPVYAASFYRNRDRIANEGLAQRLRDVERAFMACLRYTIRNMANASEPIYELDRARLSRYASDDDLFSVMPGSVFLADNDLATANVPAVRTYTIQNNIGAFLQAADQFMEMAHIVTNIPAALHGTAVGTGANRTVRGMFNLQSNALKSLQAAVANIDVDVFQPMGELFYAWNMLYEDDESVKGDSKVIAQGVQGLLAREMSRNNALEILQLVGAVGAQLGDTASPLVDWALKQTLTAMRVPDEITDQISFNRPAPAPAPELPPEAAVPPDMAAPPQDMAAPPPVTEFQ